MVERQELTYPVVYGLDPEEMTQTLDCSISLEEPIRLKPTGIVLRPDGTVSFSAYASSPIGRLTGDDTAAVIHYYQNM